MTDEKTLLELRNLEIEVDTPRGPIRPVSGISLSIPKGKTLALVGESGCGKSMTALSVMRLLPGNARIHPARIRSRVRIFFRSRKASCRRCGAAGSE